MCRFPSVGLGEEEEEGGVLSNQNKKKESLCIPEQKKQRKSNVTASGLTECCNDLMISCRRSI